MLLTKPIRISRYILPFLIQPDIFSNRVIQPKQGGPIYLRVSWTARTVIMKKPLSTCRKQKENAPRQDSMLLFQIHYHLGELYKLRRDQQASIESYQKAIEYHSLPRINTAIMKWATVCSTPDNMQQPGHIIKKGRAKRFEFTGFGKCGLPHVADRYFLFEHTKIQRMQFFTRIMP